jgi:hypothetical protein
LITVIIFGNKYKLWSFWAIKLSTHIENTVYGVLVMT